MNRSAGLLAVIASCVATSTADARSCASVRDPYPGTRYAGVDLTRITSTGVRCSTARSVARGAHRRALGSTASVNGVRTFRWNGWRVRGDLRGSNDTYVARRRGDTVRWRF